MSIDVTSLTSTPGFSGDLVTKSDPDYSKAIARWSLTNQREAKLVVYPKDAESVSATIKWALSQGLPLAVKGGGHSQSGASSVEDGVVIDLERHLGAVKVDTEEKKAFVGGGALWSTVNEETIKYGLATPGGTVSHTGVGGLILGGGYGFLSSEHGLVIDNLLEATIVTADGSILKTSESSHPDLFWGIRGGGGNFGVVTEFVLRLHPQRETVFGGLIGFPGTPELVKKIFDAAAVWAKTMTPKDGLMLILADPPGKPPMLMAIVFHNGTEEEGRKVFDWLLSQGPVMGNTGAIPYPVINTLQDPMTHHGVCYYTSSSSQDPTQNLVASAVHAKLLEQNAYNKANGVPISCNMLFEYYCTKKIVATPRSSTAFPNRSSRTNGLILLIWEKNEPATLASASKIAGELRDVVNKVQGDTPLFYANFDAEDRIPPSKVEALFKDHYPRLQKIKAQYDPNRVFSRWFGIEPAAAA